MKPHWSDGYKASWDLTAVPDWLAAPAPASEPVVQYIQVNVPVADEDSFNAGGTAAYNRVLALLDALPAASFDAATVLHIRQAVASWDSGQTPVP